MQDSRNVRLVASLCALTLAVIAVWYFQRDTKVDVDPLLFRIDDPGSISEVKLASKTRNIDLKYNGSRWIVNNKFEADDQLIKVLVATLMQAAPKRPVPSLKKDSVSLLLDQKGTKVSLYSSSGLIKEFEAGGNALRTEAWFRNEKDGRAWLMTIPGYRVYASGIFETTESDWRDKRIFNFNWRNFTQLNVTYPKDHSSDFEFVKQKDFLGIVGLQNPDSTRINNFLNDVLTLTADQIVSPGVSKEIDSVASTAPIMYIKVVDLTKRVYSLALFSPSRQNSKIIGKAWEGETVAFDKRKLFAVIKKRDYFKQERRP